MKQFKIEAKPLLLSAAQDKYSCQHLNKGTNFKETSCKNGIGLKQLRIVAIVAFCIKRKSHTSLNSVFYLSLDVWLFKFAVQQKLLSHCLTLEAMYRNVCNEISTFVAKHPTRAKTSIDPRLNPKVSQAEIYSTI